PGPELAQGIGIAYSIHFLRRNKTVPDWCSPSAGRSSSVTAASCDSSRATFAVPFLRLQFLLAHRPPFRAELEYQCLLFDRCPLLAQSGHDKNSGKYFPASAPLEPTLDESVSAFTGGAYTA